MAFQRAVKTAAKLRMMIAGPSGSGKTFTALRIAKGLAQGKPIAVIDTEHGSASKYADLFEFDVVNLAPPFTPDRFVELIHEAERGGYAVIILDSTSHAWEGEGGVLDIVQDSTVKNKGNSYVAWKDGTPVQNRFTRAMQQSNLHVIATARSKTDYVLVGEGKQAPKKVGMAPIQRNGFEYEFDVVLELDIEHKGVITKTRAVALDGKVFNKPGEDVAALLLDWLQGAPAQVAPPPAAPSTNGNGQEPRIKSNRATFNGLHAAGKYVYGDGWDAKRHELCKAVSKGRTESSKELTEAEAGKLLDGLAKKVAEKHEAENGTPAEPPAEVDFGMGEHVPTGHAE